MPVDRCYCREVTFAEALDFARNHNADLDGVCDATGAGTGCGLCVPYLRVVIATGRTALPVLGPQDVERLCAQAAAARTHGADNSPPTR